MTISPPRRRRGARSGARHAVELIWNYNASSLGRTVAEEWIAANDCAILETITIAENSLVVTGPSARGRSGITITLNRQWDLGADLAEAVATIRQRLGPT
jgi:hypothetical protein